jgi:flagellar hook-associated protein 1
MGLSYALSTSLSGLRTTQTGIELVSSNVANVNTPGYTRKNAVLDASVIAGRTSGVRIAAIQREIDTYVQRQLRTETSGLSFSNVAANYLSQLQGLFGKPGSQTSLDSLVTKFTGALDVLATTPSSQSARQDVLKEAGLLANQMNRLSSDIQDMREDADRGISSTVSRINTALRNLQQVQEQIGVMATSGTPVSPDLLDQRDLFIGQLSELADIRVSESGNGRLSIYTTNGAPLFVDNVASQLDFEGSGAIAPHALYSADPNERLIGTVFLVGRDGKKTDLLAGNLLSSGELKAFIEIRDNVLVEAQTQLDELASAMAEALGTRTVAGTAPTTPATDWDVDLSDLKAGNKVSFSYIQQPGGQTRNVTFVRVENTDDLPLSNDVTANPNDTVFGIDFSDTDANIQAQIQAALGANFAVTYGAGNLTIDTAAPAVVMPSGLSASVTATAMTGEGTAFPFFMDGADYYTGALEDGGQRLGFASRITINPALIDDPALLVNYQSPMASGDGARATFLRDALENAALQYRTDTGLGGSTSPFTGSIADFARGLIETQARNSDLAARVQEGQEVVVTSLQDRFQEKSGVDPDEEMAKLLQLQSAYAANARVITTVKEMIDVLLAM